MYCNIILRYFMHLSSNILALALPFADSFVLCCCACRTSPPVPCKLFSGASQVFQPFVSFCTLKLVPYGSKVNVCFVQHTAGQIRNRKTGGSGGAKTSEPSEAITFADVAGVDEAKEELEEIVVCNLTLNLL